MCQRWSYHNLRYNTVQKKFCLLPSQNNGAWADLVQAILRAQMQSMVSTVHYSKRKWNSGCKCQWIGGPVLRWNQEALTFCTLRTDPSWWTAAQTIVATTLAPVHTLAMLTAVHAVCTNRAGNGAVFACPTRQTLTGTWTTATAQSNNTLQSKHKTSAKYLRWLVQLHL